MVCIIYHTDVHFEVVDIYRGIVARCWRHRVFSRPVRRLLSAFLSHEWVLRSALPTAAHVSALERYNIASRTLTSYAKIWRVLNETWKPNAHFFSVEGFFFVWIRCIDFAVTALCTLAWVHTRKIPTEIGRVCLQVNCMAECVAYRILCITRCIYNCIHYQYMIVAFLHRRR